MNKTFIFDLDDTLIRTQHLYKFPQVELASVIENKLGYYAVNLSEISGILDEMEKKNLDFFNKEKNNKYSKERYPKSFEDTFKYFCNKHNLDYTQKEINKVRSIANKAFNIKKEIIEDAEEVLNFLKGQGDELILYTKGDNMIQEEKIRINQLYQWFPKKNQDYFIVNDKNVNNLKEIIDKEKKRNFFLVDNSINSIGLAYLVGINGILIPFETWWHESNKKNKTKKEIKKDFLKKSLFYDEFKTLSDIKTNYNMIKAPPEQLILTFSK